MSPEIGSTLRPPRPADYAAIASWIPDADVCVRWAGPRVPFPFAAADLQTLLFVAGSVSHCLAEGEGAPQGFAQHWVVNPGAVHLGRIIVAPDERGQGLGRRLCRLLIGRAIQTTGASTVTLRVYRDNLVARTLYSSLSFTAVDSECTEHVLFMAMRVAAVSS